MGATVSGKVMLIVLAVMLVIGLAIVLVLTITVLLVPCRRCVRRPARARRLVCAHRLACARRLLVLAAVVLAVCSCLPPSCLPSCSCLPPSYLPSPYKKCTPLYFRYISVVVIRTPLIFRLQIRVVIGR